MLSFLDDYPVHQTAETVSEKPEHKNFYHRYWYNGYDKDGEFYFAIGTGIYPNKGIHDAAFGLTIDGTQYAFFTSEHYTGERQLKTCIGPFELEMLTPMRSSRVLIKPNKTGIEADLTFTARTCSIEEDRQTFKLGELVLMDVTRFAQLGRWQGYIKYKGKTLKIDQTRVMGTKDRSWGIRRLGPPKPNEPKIPFFFLWSPVHWDNHCSHFCLFQDPAGNPLNKDGAIVPAYPSMEKINTAVDPDEIRYSTLKHDLSFVPGTRRVNKAILTMSAPDRDDAIITLEPLITFNMAGLGYNHPEWSQGQDKGESAIGYEEWKPSEMAADDPLNQHVQTVMRATSGSETGIGVLEQAIFGPCEQYGFKDHLDGA